MLEAVRDGLGLNVVGADILARAGFKKAAEQYSNASSNSSATQGGTSQGEPDRDRLLRKAQDPDLRDAVDNLYRKNAKIGSGSSMDAYRYEVKTGWIVMTNFNSIPDRSPEIILRALRQKAPEFFTSDEYLRLARLDPKFKESPGLICGVFTKLLCTRMQKDEDVERYFDILEIWATAKDAHVENYLITEVFENVNLPASGEEQFKDNLRPTSRQLYERWMEYPPEDRLSAR